MNATQTSITIDDKDTDPWWTQGYLWFILAGPAIVAVAAIATMAIALDRPDPLVSANYYKEGLDINRTLKAVGRGDVPAELGRNHAATPPRSLPEPSEPPRR